MKAVINSYCTRFQCAFDAHCTPSDVTGDAGNLHQPFLPVFVHHYLLSSVVSFSGPIVLVKVFVIRVSSVRGHASLCIC